MKTLMMALGLALATPTLATPALPTPARAMAEQWQLISSSTTTAYLADIDSIATAEGVTTIRIARVRKAPANPADLSHAVDEYGFRCSADQIRFVATSDYGSDGALIERYVEDAPWEDIGDSALFNYIHDVACDGDRSADGTWPNVQAFMASDREG